MKTPNLLDESIHNEGTKFAAGSNKSYSKETTMQFFATQSLGWYLEVLS